MENIKKKIFENYEKIWKVTSLIAFVGIILNFIFLKFEWLIIAICIIYLIIIIPSGIIAKKEDNKLGEKVRAIAMDKEDKGEI